MTILQITLERTEDEINVLQEMTEHTGLLLFSVKTKPIKHLIQELLLFDNKSGLIITCLITTYGKIKKTENLQVFGRKDLI